MAEGAFKSIASSFGVREAGDGRFVFNPDLNARVLRLHSDQPIAGGQPAEEGFVFSSDEIVGPLGARTGRMEPANGPVHATRRTLENRFVRVEVGDDGTIRRIFAKRL